MHLKKDTLKGEILSNGKSSIKVLLCIRVRNSKHRGRRGYSPYLRSSWEKNSSNNNKKNRILRPMPKKLRSMHVSLNSRTSEKNGQINHN